MLTKLHNRHFSERLFYADSVSAFVGVSPCFNGNIAVSRVTNADTGKERDAETFLRFSLGHDPVMLPLH